MRCSSVFFWQDCTAKLKVTNTADPAKRWGFKMKEFDFCSEVPNFIYVWLLLRYRVQISIIFLPASVFPILPHISPDSASAFPPPNLLEILFRNTPTSQPVALHWGKLRVRLMGHVFVDGPSPSPNLGSWHSIVSRLPFVGFITMAFFYIFDRLSEVLFDVFRSLWWGLTPFFLPTPSTYSLTPSLRSL